MSLLRSDLSVTDYAGLRQSGFTGRIPSPGMSWIFVNGIELTNEEARAWLRRSENDRIVTLENLGRAPPT